MKNFSLLFGAFLALASCSNDDNVVVEDNSILPKTISYTYPDFPSDNSKIVLTYSGNKIVSSIQEGSKTLFTYDGNVIVKQEQFDVDSKGKETKDTQVEYTYENGKLKTRTISESFTTNYPSGQYIKKTVYKQTSNVLISYTNYSVDPSTKAEERSSDGSLTYKDGNLIAEQQFVGSETSTRTYEYDAKNNPLKNIEGFDLLLNEISEYGTNNIVKTTSKKQLASQSTDYPRTYVYNDKGYPTKNTALTGGGKSIEYEIEYTY